MKQVRIDATDNLVILNISHIVTQRFDVEIAPNCLWHYFFWQIVKLTAKFLLNESWQRFYSALIQFGYLNFLVSVAFLSYFYVKLLPAESLHQKENTKTQWATIQQFPF